MTPLSAWPGSGHSGGPLPGQAPCGCRGRGPSPLLALGRGAWIKAIHSCDSGADRRGSVDRHLRLRSTRMPPWAGAANGGCERIANSPGDYKLRLRELIRGGGSAAFGPASSASNPQPLPTRRACKIRQIADLQCRLGLARAGGTMPRAGSSCQRSAGPRRR